MSVAITLNGKTHQLKPNSTVKDLVASLQLDATKIAIERNLAIVPHSAYDNTALESGDVIEVVEFIGGG